MKSSIAESGKFLVLSLPLPQAFQGFQPVQALQALQALQVTSDPVSLHLPLLCLKFHLFGFIQTTYFRRICSSNGEFMMIFLATDKYIVQCSIKLKLTGASVSYF